MEFEDCCGCNSCEPGYEEPDSTICSYLIPKEGERYPEIKDLSVCLKEENSRIIKEEDEKLKKMYQDYLKRDVKRLNRMIVINSIIAILTGICVCMPIIIPDYIDLSFMPLALLKIGAVGICAIACCLNIQSALESWNLKKDSLQSILEADDKVGGNYD